MRPVLYAMTVAGLFAGGACFAQTSSSMQTAPGSTQTAPSNMKTQQGGGMQTAPSATTGTVGGTARSAANGAGNAASSASNGAAINRNPAVATTSANDPAPAKGANSFTMGEAKTRLERNGYSNVSSLTKDNDGVWRGQAQKNGQQTTVWLDYKGNTGTGK